MERDGAVTFSVFLAPAGKFQLTGVLADVKIIQSEMFLA